MKILEGTRSALPFTAAALLLLGTAVPALSQDGSNSSGTTTTTTTTTVQTTTQGDGATAPAPAVAAPFTKPDVSLLRTALVENQRQLRQYSWESTATMTVNDKLQNTETFAVSPEPGQPFQWKSISHKEEGFANRKQEQDARSFRSRLQNLAASYREELRPANLEKFISTADYDAGVDSLNGTIRIKGANIVQPNDEMILWVTPDLRPKRLEIHTALDKDLVTSTTTFTALEGGPSAPLRTEIHVPSKNAVMVIEDSKFQRYVDHQQL